MVQGFTENLHKKAANISSRPAFSLPFRYVGTALSFHAELTDTQDFFLNLSFTRCEIEFHVSRSLAVHNQRRFYKEFVGLCSEFPLIFNYILSSVEKTGFSVQAARVFGLLFLLLASGIVCYSCCSNKCVFL